MAGRRIAWLAFPAKSKSRRWLFHDLVLGQKSAAESAFSRASASASHESGESGGSLYIKSCMLPRIQKEGNMRLKAALIRIVGLTILWGSAPRLGVGPKPQQVMPVVPFQAAGFSSRKSGSSGPDQWL